MNPEAQYNQRAAGANPYHGDRSYETVASGSGTSGDRPGYGTDPTSSDNSSVERQQASPKRQLEPVNDYGIGFNHAADYHPSSFTVSGNGGPQYGSPAGGAGTAQVPRSEASVMRQPVQDAQAEPGKQKKRRSFFGIGKGS